MEGILGEHQGPESRWARTTGDPVAGYNLPLLKIELRHTRWDSLIEHPQPVLPTSNLLALSICNTAYEIDSLIAVATSRHHNSSQWPSIFLYRMC